MDIDGIDWELSEEANKIKTHESLLCQSAPKLVVFNRKTVLLVESASS